MKEVLLNEQNELAAPVFEGCIYAKKSETGNVIFLARQDNDLRFIFGSLAANGKGSRGFHRSLEAAIIYELVQGTRVFEFETEPDLMRWALAQLEEKTAPGSRLLMGSVFCSDRKYYGCVWGGVKYRASESARGFGFFSIKNKEVLTGYFDTLPECIAAELGDAASSVIEFDNLDLLNAWLLSK